MDEFSLKFTKILTTFRSNLQKNGRVLNIIPDNQ